MGFDLDRFKKAQEEDYPYALQEIKAGRKRSTGFGTSFRS